MSAPERPPSWSAPVFASAFASKCESVSKPLLGVDLDLDLAFEAVCDPRELIRHAPHFCSESWPGSGFGCESG